MDMDLSDRSTQKQARRVRLRSYCPTALVVVALALCEGAEQGWPSTAYAQSSAGRSSDAQRSAASAYFTDVVLINQYGKEMRLYSDLIKGHTVIVIPFFTSCNGACPVMNRNLAKIQEWLGERLGKDAYIISLSVDPSTDTVERLRAYRDEGRCPAGLVLPQRHTRERGCRPYQAGAARGEPRVAHQPHDRRQRRDRAVEEGLQPGRHPCAHPRCRQRAQRQG